MAPESGGLTPQPTITSSGGATMAHKPLRIERYNPDRHTFDPEMKHVVGAETARGLRIVPVQKVDKLLLVAMVDHVDIRTLDKLEKLTRLEVEPILCTEQDLNQLAQAVYGTTFDITEMLSSMEETGQEGEAEAETDKQADEITIGSIRDMVQEAPVVRMVNSILVQAVRDKASDIHLSPEKDRIQIRFRVDGVLKEVPAPPKTYALPITSRMKLLANMDISVSRIPQDGRFTFRTEDQEISVRASTLPTIHGENVVLRLLRQTSGGLSLDDLGLLPGEQRKFERAVDKPFGMVLSTGPTGSGKSTLLFALLRKINKPEINVITLEDPVEYRIPGIRQVQLNRKAGMTFASGLRSILRQDPDVIMVGEIRDTETAHIAIESALTGHLVLSTLHTNNASQAVTRFMEMGIEPFLISSTLLLAGAQRLVRRICGNCLAPYEPAPELMEAMGLQVVPGAPFLRGEGCFLCNNTGYRGRVGIYETLEVTDLVQDLIIARASSLDIARQAEEAGILRSLKRDALDKALQGYTTLEEAASAVLV